MTTRIAMWSGPRNISTAMMRAWENRADCTVVDEPFYACYLSQTQSPHPMFDEVIKSQSTNFACVADLMSKATCESKVQYQKHMTHHMPDNCDMSWAKNLRHCFLIRDPAYVVNSYTNSRGVCSAQDTGLQRQYELYKELSELTSQTIPVVDSYSVLQNPKTQIEKMCAALDVKFDNAMLSWPAGKRDSDGVWASHWYHSVEKSTGFGEAKQANFVLNEQQKNVVNEIQPFYDALKSIAL